MKKCYKHPTIKVLELKERLTILASTATGEGPGGATDNWEILNPGEDDGEGGEGGIWE